VSRDAAAGAWRARATGPASMTRSPDASSSSWRPGAPWVQPWASGGASVGLRRNAVTQRAYSGINVLILWEAVIRHGYAAQDWLTFRQAQKAGGRVRKGERGVSVVYAGRFTPEDEKARDAKGEEEPRAIPFLRRFTVFNDAQCDGLNANISDSVAVAPTEPLAVAEMLIRASEVDIKSGAIRPSTSRSSIS